MLYLCMLLTRLSDVQKTSRSVLSGLKPQGAASFLNGFKNIPEKACVNRFHNNQAFENVGNLHTRKTF